MRQVSNKGSNVSTINTQAQTPSIVNVLDLANSAVESAENALIKAKEALASIGGSQGSKAPKAGSRGSKAKAEANTLNGATDPANDSKGSAGRNPSAEQLEIRNAIIEALQTGEIRFFTIAEVTEAMKADRIQTRNAVNYLEAQGIVTRYGEKLPEGRGQRELIYKAGNVPAEPVA
jgi:hypothetical protein